MAKVRFERLVEPVGFIQFTRNPSYGSDVDPFSFVQPSDRTDSGGSDSWVVYTKGRTDEEASLFFASISEEDYQNLKVFLRDVVDGSAYSFDYRDYNGDIFTALMTPGQNINFPPKAFGRRSGALQLVILDDRREFFQLDNNEDIMPREFTTGLTDNFFEEDSNGDFEPLATITGTSEFFELDGNGDIQPI